MSLILEALNRSAAERQNDNGAPGLAAPNYADATADEGRWPRSLPWIALLAASLVIGALLVERGYVATPSERANAENELQPAVPAPRTTVVPATITPPPAAAPAPAPIALQPSPTSQPAARADTAVAALYGDRREVPDANGDATGKPAKPEKGVVEQPIDIEAVLARTEEALKTARLEEHPAPFVNDLSQNVKNGIPTILYSRHEYSSDAAQSSVVLNGTTVKAGGKLSAGIKVDEILSDSIVLSHRGTQFRLRALNSWVNL